MVKTARITILLLLIVAAFSVAMRRLDRFWFGVSTAATQLRAFVTAPNRLQLNGGVGETISVPIHPLAELDGLTQEQLFTIRRAAVASQPRLVLPPYEPSPAVFSMIEDGKPWWGIEGIFFYGPGPHAADGLSEESRFLLNPYLLVAVQESSAFVTPFAPAGASGYYPGPSNLRYQPSSKQASVTYSVSGFFRHLKRLGLSGPEDRVLSLQAYNARDFGYHFLSIDAQRSDGVRWRKLDGDIEESIQFIHAGGSCGMPSGCNNASPDQPGMRLSVESLPAHAMFKLWREKPDDARRGADFEFLVVFADENGRVDGLPRRID